MAEQLTTLAKSLKCHLILYGFNHEQRGEELFLEDLDTGWTELEISYLRACRLIDGEVFESITAQIPLIPLTADELKNEIKIRYETDELKAVQMLKGEASKASAIVLELGLTRDIVRQALARLEHDRAKQVVLCSILCATRFKYYEGGDLLNTSCAKCGKEDNFKHLLKCADLTAPAPRKNPEETINFLVELASRAQQIHNGIPIPIRSNHDGANPNAQNLMANDLQNTSQPNTFLDEISLDEAPSSQENPESAPDQPQK